MPIAHSLVMRLLLAPSRMSAKDQAVPTAKAVTYSETFLIVFLAFFV